MFFCPDGRHKPLCSTIVNYVYPSVAQLSFYCKHIVTQVLTKCNILYMLNFVKTTYCVCAKISTLKSAALFSPKRNRRAAIASSFFYVDRLRTIRTPSFLLCAAIFVFKIHIRILTLNYTFIRIIILFSRRLRLRNKPARHPPPTFFSSRKMRKF